MLSSTHLVTSILVNGLCVQTHGNIIQQDSAWHKTRAHDARFAQAAHQSNASDQLEGDCDLVCISGNENVSG